MWPMWCKELIVDFPAERTTLVWPSEVEGSGGSEGSEVFYVNMCQYQMIANECKWHEVYWYMMIYDDQQWSVDKIISTCKISTFAILWYLKMFASLVGDFGTRWWSASCRRCSKHPNGPRGFQETSPKQHLEHLGTSWNVLDRVNTNHETGPQDHLGQSQTTWLKSGKSTGMHTGNASYHVSGGPKAKRVCWRTC